jgi:hypothetical protein
MPKMASTEQMRARRLGRVSFVLLKNQLDGVLGVRDLVLGLLGRKPWR